MKFLITVLLAFGLYYLISDRIGFPSLASVRAVTNFGGGGMSMQDRLISPIANKLQKCIHLEEYRKRELKNTLKAAGLAVTPELYIAKAAAKAGIIILLSFIVLPIVPIATPLIIALGVYLFFKDIHSAREIIGKKRVAIENELQQFTSAVVQALGHRQDLFRIIQSYRQIAGIELGAELDILLTEMRTGNRFEALTNFESRIDSPLVSELVRGMVGVDRGDDMSAYLTSVEMHAKDLKVSNLKKEATKRPEKLALASFVLFGAMLAMYVAVIIVQLKSGYHAMM